MLFPSKQAVLGTVDFQQLTQTLSPESQFQATPTSLVSDLETLNTLRRRVFSGDGSEVEVVLTYAAHIGRLSVLAPRGPVAFTWSSWASSKSEGGGSGSVASVASFAVAFERANALCVAAAVAANSADLNWPKDAAKRLCTAAAAFAEAANTLDAALKSGAASQADTRDAPLCQALSACALAMAQEAFVTKAVLDSLSSATIAKLATAAANLFESASASLSPLATSNPSLASWPPFLAVKCAHLAAIADFNLAKQAAASSEIGKYGTEIGYLKRAQAALTKADPDLLPQTSILSSWIKPSTPDSGSSAALPASLKQELRNLYDQITQILIPAEKDNDKIYMEIVPSLENLPVPSPAVMVKPDFPSLTPPNITPLFQNILPPHLRSLHAKYTTSLAAHLAPILTTDLPTATSTCKSTLASLNLPGSLLSLSKSTTQFLQDLRGAHPQGFSAKALNHQTNTLQTLRSTCFQTLSSAVQSLDQESRDDAEMRTSFGPHKWTRVDSETLTRGLREAATKYQEKLDAARSSDDVIFQKVEANYERICVLGEEGAVVRVMLGDVDLAGANGGGVDFEKREEVVKLKAVLALLNEVVAKRDDIVKQVEEMQKKEDVVQLLLDASQTTSDEINQESFISLNLAKYDALLQTAQASIKSQDNIMALVLARNQKFVEWKQTNCPPSLLKREQFAQDYTIAQQVYKEIMGNLSTGIRFYSDFEPILTRFATNCSDYCMTRNIEKKELLAEVQRGSLEQQRPPVWDGNIQYNFNPNPPSSVPPPFQRGP